MEESNDFVLLKQIRSLLDQLEHNTPKKVAADYQESISKKLLQISCDRYWTYDPLINSIVLYITQVGGETQNTITRSFSTLQANVDMEDRLKINTAFERMLKRLSTREMFSYTEKVNDKFITYDIVACTYEVDNLIKIVGITHIRSEQEKSIEALLKVQQKFELLMGLSSTFIWEYDVQCKCFSANRSFCDKLGLEEKAYDVDTLNSIIEVQEMKRFIEKIEEKTMDEKAIVHIRLLNNNYTYIFETDFKAVRDKYGDFILLIGTMLDITEHEMLRTMASKDTLTDCYNRNMADVTLESSFKTFQETGDFCTIIFFDIDKFKNVNDRYGHDMGDFVLTSVCSKIAKEIRSNDMMFRWGGDEFLLICRGIAKENIYGYIDRLRKNIEFSTFEFKGTKLQLTISIGAAIFYKTDPDFSYAMKRADRSLYKAKLAGRNKVCILN